MDEIWLSARLLLLLSVANGAPILAQRLLGTRWNAPLDGGMRFFDGRPILGSGKTVRGALIAILATTLAASALGISMGLGALIGAVAMAGDALSSFIKRRLGLATGDQGLGVDQIPESLLPLLAVRQALDLSLLQILGVTAAFFALELPLARLLYRMGIRDRPY
jgi:CDP-2,3-bis-(O-geranylgeranyl)-sn-glycerol synthase